MCFSRRRSRAPPKLLYCLQVYVAFSSMAKYNLPVFPAFLHSLPTPSTLCSDSMTDISPKTPLVHPLLPCSIFSVQMTYYDSPQLSAIQKLKLRGHLLCVCVFCYQSLFSNVLSLHALSIYFHPCHSPDHSDLALLICPPETVLTKSLKPFMLLNEWLSLPSVNCVSH